MRPKTLVIIPTVRSSPAFKAYADNFDKNGHRPDVMVLDEVAGAKRGPILEAFNDSDCNLEFYCELGRKEWMEANGVAEWYEHIIPKKSHDETSFGFLVALKRNCYDMILTIDDDTYPDQSMDFIGTHWKALEGTNRVIEGMQSRWVNTHPCMPVRGYPYCQRDVYGSGSLVNIFPTIKKNVLNMGQWYGTPDLNAVDYIALKVRDYLFEDFKPDFDNYVVKEGFYFPICSMNLAFRPEIIPAFYQLYDNNRYNDILSGVLLKKIADHLGYGMGFGMPLCNHEKAPRDLFGNLALEVRAMTMNEWLWHQLDRIELHERTWLGCYHELALKLAGLAPITPDPTYLEAMAIKMYLWTCTVRTLLGGECN